MLAAKDEVFFTGTAAEITPVGEVDDRSIGNGNPGPITKQLQSAYFALVKGTPGGELPTHPEWLSFV